MSTSLKNSHLFLLLFFFFKLQILNCFKLCCFLWKVYIYFYKSRLYKIILKHCFGENVNIMYQYTLIICKEINAQNIDYGAKHLFLIVALLD